MGATDCKERYSPVGKITTQGDVCFNAMKRVYNECLGQAHAVNH